jgi:hypothetical protein
MAWTRRRFAVLACFAGAMTLAIGIGVATGAKLKTQSETVAVDAGEHGSATAECKRGTKAVSGGFEAEYRGAGGPLFFLDQSSRTGAGRWTSEAFHGGLATGDLTSLAYCRDEKVKSRASTESVAADETETVSAKCKRDTKAVSGGFDAEEYDLTAPESPFFSVTASRKVGPRTWEVRALNDGGGAGDLTAQVNCREGKGLRTQQVTEEVAEPGVTFDVFDLEATCKRKRRVVSGGFAGPDASSGGELIRPFASMKVGRRGWHLDGFGAGEVTVYAYCEKKKA